MEKETRLTGGAARAMARPRKMNRRPRTVRAAVLLGALAAAPVPAAAQFGACWPVAQLAAAPAPQVVLRENRRPVATIPTRWFIAVNHINRRINAVSGVDARFILCASSEPNAFAGYPGGEPFVGLTMGMRELLGDDWHAYAAILGHENAHLVRNHGRKRQQRESVAALGQLLGGALLSGAGGAVVANSVNLTAQAVTSGYSQEDEHEADRDGMHYAQAAGFDPRGALTLHAKLKSASHFLHSHPSSADRIRRLKAELRRNGW